MGTRCRGNRIVSANRFGWTFSLYSPFLVHPGLSLARSPRVQQEVRHGPLLQVGRHSSRALKNSSCNKAANTLCSEHPNLSSLPKRAGKVKPNPKDFTAGSGIPWHTTRAGIGRRHRLKTTFQRDAPSTRQLCTFLLHRMSGHKHNKTGLAETLASAPGGRGFIVSLSSSSGCPQTGM